MRQAALAATVLALCSPQIHAGDVTLIKDGEPHAVVVADAAVMAADRVGAFAYSAVEGAAANALPDQVPEPLKQERLARFMEVQARISAAKLQDKIGQTMLVLVDDVDEENAVGRSMADAPEIDGVVYLEGGAGLLPGDLVEVEITGADEHDLYAGPA